MSMKSWKPITVIVDGALPRSWKSAIRAAIVIVLIFGLGVGALPVQAASVSWDGDAGNGLWSDPLNWVGNTLPQSDDTIVISGSAGEVVLDTDFTLVGKLTINGNGNTLRIENGITLTLDPDLAPGQYDAVIVDNGGTLINDGIIEGATLSPLPRIYVTSTSVYDSTFTNNSTLNELSVYLRGGPQNPTLNNNGTMNTVRISTLVGAVNNSGLIDDAQLLLQFGTVDNEVGGTINITFTLGGAGSRFINSTVFDNHGTVTNEATIDNEGIFNNFGTFDNTNGTFINSCDLVNGTVGIFNNTGFFSGNPISNEGSIWDNDSGNELWSDPSNWSSDILPASTNDIVINIVNGVDTTVTVDVDITIDGKLSLRNGTGPPTTTTLVIPGGVTLTNTGSITFGSDTTINNQGSIVNNGDIRASGSASFINDGSFSGNPVTGINSTWDGGGGDGLWSTPENWVGDTLPQTGNYIFIWGSAGEVVLDTDFTLVGKLTINGEGNTLRVGSGITLTLDPDLAPGQYDAVIVDNGGTLINDGVIEGATLSPLPRIYVTSTSVYDSTFTNNSTLNELSVYLRGGPQNPTLSNNGTMNTVRISTLVGAVNNSGLIDDAQLLLQFGTVDNEVGGTINITFTLGNAGSRFINSTVFDNHGMVINEATIDNKGIFNNFGTFDNTNGTFDNQGTFNAYCGSTFIGTISGNPINEIPCNAAPEVSDIPDQTIDEGDTLTLTVTATDPDEDPLTLSAIGLPTGASFTDDGDGTGILSWTPTEIQGPGSYSVTFTATDDGSPPLSDSETITITVYEVNQPPILNPIGGKNVDEGQTLTFTVTASDPDFPANTLTLSASGLPSGASFSQSTAEFSWTPVEADGGTYSVTFEVSDGVGGSDSETITIIVNEVNESPVITVPSGPQIVKEGGNPVGNPPSYEPLTFTLTATDPDIPANTLTFSSPNLPTGATLDPVSGEFEWMPDYNAFENALGGQGVYIVTFTVSDDGSPPQSHSSTVTINVENEPLGATEDIEASDGGTVTNESGTAEVDIPPDALSEDTTISIEPHSQYTLQDVYGEIIGLQYAFSPSGIIFDEPVTIRLYYDPLVVLEPWLVDIYYYNEPIDLWEQMHATLDLANHCFYIEVDHFSTFAMVELPTPVEINDYIQSLPDDAFDKNPEQRRNALDNKLTTLFDLNNSDAMIKKGDIRSAINKLLNDIRPKMDGEGDDWIVDSTAQQELCTMIDTLVNHLQAKL